MTTLWKLQYRLYSLGCLLNGKLSINEPLRNEKSFPQKKQTHGFFFSDISFFNNTSTPTKSIEVKEVLTITSREAQSPVHFGYAQHNFMIFGILQDVVLNCIIKQLS